MKITLVALGSTGDLLPCVALGGALVEAGHRVRLASFEHFRPIAQRHGLSFSPVAGDVQAMLRAGGTHMPRVLFQFINRANAYVRDFSAPELLDADLILNQLPGGLFGWDLAEKLSIPMIALAYLPLVPTGGYPMIGFPRIFSASPGYNRLTYRISQQMVWLIFRGAVNRWRRDTLELPPQRPGGRFHELGSPSCPLILGFSPALIPPQPDWPAKTYVTGYWYPQDPDWQPSLELLRFLNDGPPPVFIGFGSMVAPNPENLLAKILRAVGETGQRAVLHAGWTGMGGKNLPSGVFAIDYAPYDWLFPRMAGLVIHGGAGSVHFALRSSRPTQIVPFMFDQFTWGRRFAQLGIGPAPLPFRGLTSIRLAGSIHELATNASMAGRAAAVASAVRLEPGIAEAVRTIESI